MRYYKASNEKTAKEEEIEIQIENWDKKIKKGVSDMMNEEDPDLKSEIRDQIKEMKEEKVKLEKMILKYQEEKREKKERIIDALKFAKIQKDSFRTTEKELKRKMLLKFGSNWKISSKNVVCKPSKEIKGLQEINDFQLGVKAKYRTKKNGLYKTKKLPRELLISKWSG